MRLSDFVILVNAEGKPFERPRRSDFPTDAAYVEAFHAYKQKVTNEANEAFDKAFRASLRK